MKKLIFLFLAIICSGIIQAQQLDLLKNLNVDELSDKQIEELMSNMKDEGVSINQIDQYAAAKGASTIEIAKLKKRMVKYNDKSSGVKNHAHSQSKSPDHKIASMTDQEKAKYYDAFIARQDSINSARPLIFGASIFKDVNLTFEPNLRLATPENYVLGPDDELLIDIYGVSEISHKAYVTPEGNIKIPNIGIISVGGLTIEDARKVIKRKLSTVYGGISAGNTFVNIALGDIRSITVNVIGEIVYPGSYTIPSLATVFNALYQSGGPKESGSFRNIQVIRNSRVIANIDLYDFIVYGKQSNLRLRDQDAIKVLPYKDRVTITGEVKTPAIFEMKAGETIKDLIEFAGGFTENAYRERITASRNTLKEKSIIDVPYSDFRVFKTESGDEYKVGKLLNRYINRVQISGAVYRPGAYALTGGMSVKGLIEKAEGLKEDAMVNHAIVYRKNQFGLPEIVSFTPKDVLEGKTNLLLQRDDSVYIASILDMKEKEFVFVSGEVIHPDKYPFAEGMTLKDALILANGFNSKANSKEVEVFRQITDEHVLNENIQKAESFKVSITKDFNNNDEASSFKLKKNDRIIVRPIFGYQEAQEVKIEGEIMNPGVYVLTANNQRISDLIRKAGGLTTFAYPDGAFLIRKREKSESEKMMLRERSGLITTKGINGQNNIDSLTIKDELLNESEIVAIDLKKILKKPESAYDIKLEQGDAISIPKSLETVKVSGEVLCPTTVRFQNGKSLKYYVDNAGGFGSNAKRSKSYVIHANGTGEVTKSFFGFKFYPKVKPGSKIIIPKKMPRNGLNTAETISLATSFVSIVAIITSLFRK